MIKHLVKLSETGLEAENKKLLAKLKEYETKH